MVTHTVVLQPVIEVLAEEVLVMHNAALQPTTKGSAKEVSKAMWQTIDTYEEKAKEDSSGSWWRSVTNLACTY